MGGKSRKTGAPSLRLIRRIQGKLPQTMGEKRKTDAEIDKTIAQMGDKILDRIQQDCEKWNKDLSNLNPEKEVNEHDR